jgi:hypothetical protein
LIEDFYSSLLDEAGTADGVERISIDWQNHQKKLAEAGDIPHNCG